MSILKQIKVPYFKEGSEIHIKEKNKGKFTQSAKQHGMGVQKFASHVLSNKDQYNPTLVKRANFARNAKAWKHQQGGVIRQPSDTLVSKYNRAVYSSVNPIVAYPGWLRAGRAATQAAIKASKDKQDEMQYEVGTTLGEKVADAGWRKYLGLSYDEKLLPIFNEDTVRLPKQLELEIPVDTNFIKKRIANTKRLMNLYDKYYFDPMIQSALKIDEETLEALRKTYKTGKPVGVNEFAHNSRQWVTNGIVEDEPISPLNVFQNFNIRYDKGTNRMYYSDQYDLNQFEWGSSGKPYRFRGYIDLNKKNAK